jgi:hypothetical protein
MQSVPITTKVVSSNLVHGEVYSIQHNVIKFVSDLRQFVLIYLHWDREQKHHLCYFQEVQKTAMTTMISSLQHTNFNTQIKMVNFISCLAVVIKLVYKNITTLNTLILLFYPVFFHWYDEISCFVASHWQTWSHIDNILPWTRFGLTTLVVIGTDYTGSCKSNYHMITTETSPMNFKETAICKLEWIY